MTALEEKLKILNNRVSYHRKPEILTLEEWQIALRKQFAAQSQFVIKNIGDHPYYSDFSVYNPSNKNTYKVAIRSHDEAGNFCSCMDFKTNCLGTCKHIEAVLLKIKNDPKAIRYSANITTPRYTSIYLKYGNIRIVKIRIGSENRDEFRKLAEKYFDADYSLLPASFYKIESLLEEASAIHPEFRCYSDALEFILDMREKRKRIFMLDQKYHPERANGSYDQLIRAKLFQYQKEGIYFVACAGKSLLADDMGLGKTVQAIAGAELLKKESGITKTLIVCPTSLKYQWKSEIEKFTDSSVKVVEGVQTKRMDVYRNDNSYYKIISYNTLSNDVEYINEFEPDLVILDEAQRIKNWKTKIAQNVKKVKTDYAMVLTGTPLENKLEELYSILQFVDAFALGPLYQYLNNHQVKDEHGKIIGYQNLNEIGRELSDVLLRRKKSEVLSQLPERMDKNLMVPMTEKQMEIHTEYADMVARLVHKWRRFGFLNEKDRQKLMIGLNMMRMVCDSTYVLDQETRYDTKIEELMCIIDEVIGQHEEKIVVFSQWERMTRLVSFELDDRKVKYEYLHGGVPSEKRRNLFENFNNDPECKVFLSTDAGGVGLNLQAASVLINLDIPWNPAILEQRIARIHRLGQKRNVAIINLVSIGTIEHRMLDVLKFKSSMAEGVLDCGENNIFMGEDRFKQFMKSVEQLTAQPEVTPETELDIIPVEDDKEEVLKLAAFVSDEPAETLVGFPETSVEKVEPVAEASEKTEAIAEETGKREVVGEETEKAERILEEDERTSSVHTKPEESGAELIRTGADFFGRLVKTLSDKDATQKLVASLVAKDEKTGQTYVKIPVENEKVVENALNLLGGLFGMIKK